MEVVTNCYYVGKLPEMKIRDSDNTTFLVGYYAILRNNKNNEITCESYICEMSVSFIL